MVLYFMHNETESKVSQEIVALRVISENSCETCVVIYITKVRLKLSTECLHVNIIMIQILNT